MENGSWGFVLFWVWVLFQFKIFILYMDMKVYPHLIRKIICTGLNPRVYFPFECVSRELVPLFFTMHRPYLENNWCPREVYTAWNCVSGLEWMLSWIVYSLGAQAAAAIPFLAFSSLSSFSFYLLQLASCTKSHDF